MRFHRFKRFNPQRASKMRRIPSLHSIKVYWSHEPHILIKILLMIGGIESNPGPNHGDSDDEQALEFEGTQVMEELGKIGGNKEAQQELVDRHWALMPLNTRRNYDKGIKEFKSWCLFQGLNSVVTVDKVLSFLRSKGDLTTSMHSMIIKSLGYSMRQQYILRYDPSDPEIYTPLTKMPQIMVETELSKKQHERTRRRLYKDRQEGTTQDGYSFTLYHDAHDFLMKKSSYLNTRDRYENDVEGLTIN